MQVRIYLDLIFIINFLVDIYILLITGYLLHQNINFHRILLSAVLEAAIIVPYVMYPTIFMGVYGVIISSGISIGAVAISFGRRRLIKKWFLSTTVMVLFGGIFMFIKRISGTLHITIYIWIIFFLVSGLTVYLMLQYLIRTKEELSHICTVCIAHNDNVIKEKIFVDSGNRLWDDYFHKPVILLSQDLIKKIVSNEDYKIIEKYQKDGYIDYDNPIFLRLQRNMCFHEVAYKSVGKSSGKLICFLIENIEVIDNGKQYRKQPVASVDAKLFSGKNYKGLLFVDDI